MKLDRVIRAVTVTAAIVWSAAGAIEFAAGWRHSGTYPFR